MGAGAWTFLIGQMALVFCLFGLFWGWVREQRRRRELQAIVEDLRRKILKHDYEVADGGFSAGCPLTLRELEVLSLVAEGHPNKVIAGKMNISM